MIMSTEKTALQNQSGSSTKRNVKVDHAAEKRQPVVQNVEIEALKIDETFDGDFDPYNSTGQFLSDAIKRKYDDS